VFHESLCPGHRASAKLVRHRRLLPQLRSRTADHGDHRQSLLAVGIL